MIGLLWFAWKFVPLWYQQQPYGLPWGAGNSCDLLENSYLCGISNNPYCHNSRHVSVVICLKIRTFVVSATTHIKLETALYKLWFAWKFVPLWYQQQQERTHFIRSFSCDLLENSYLCGISNNTFVEDRLDATVVICLKIRTFVVSATTWVRSWLGWVMLWFAWKFVPLWYQQQPFAANALIMMCCDLLENSYLCGISNNSKKYN